MKIIKAFAYVVLLYISIIVSLETVVIIANITNCKSIENKGVELIKTLSFTNDKL